MLPSDLEASGVVERLVHVKVLMRMAPPSAVAEAEALGLGNLGYLPGAGQSSPWMGGIQRCGMVSSPFHVYKL